MSRQTARMDRQYWLAMVLLFVTACATARVQNDAGDAGDDADSETVDDGDVTDDGGGYCGTETVTEDCGEGVPCIEGRCCNEPCVGTCLSCAVAGLEGICSFVPFGEDPGEECAEETPESCGMTGVCDGRGACQYYGPSTLCDDSDECTTRDACSGDGDCRGDAPEGCDPGPANQCCEVACTTDGGCATEASTCPERCSEHQLIVGQACVGCGAPGAEGVCTGGEARSCNESRHTQCEEILCDGVTYYCTNQEGEWAWRTTVPCDDEESCTFGDACLGGECVTTDYACDSDSCTNRECDGEGACLETHQPAATACGTEVCPADGCIEGTWADYPTECTRLCDGEGTCGSCECHSAETTCSVGVENQCCIVSCVDATGCATLPGSCGTADTCSATVLEIASACSGCGPPGANGVCGGRSTLTCDATTHDLCHVASCGGTTYYCTNHGGTWQWRATDPSCNDGDDCTFGDTCGATGCAGSAISCVDGDCMVRACNGTSTCGETPLIGTVCDDGDPCTWGETCTAEGVCPSGTTISCIDTDCIDRGCNGTSTCTEVILSGDACDDGDPCTWDDHCGAAGACTPGTPIDCDSSDWTCMDSNCDGTSTCAETPINLGAGCDDGDPLTDDDQCQADGSCAGEAGCPPPADSCVNGTQDRDRCSGARVIGRTVASGGHTIEDTTCWARDRFDEDGGCWDANSDHAYRIYLREGESLYLRYRTDDPCESTEWIWYGTLSIYENGGCDDTACTTRVHCDYNETNQEVTYVAPRDGWIIVVADGSSVFDDEGSYRLDFTLTCNEPGCEC